MNFKEVRAALIAVGVNLDAFHTENYKLTDIDRKKKDADFLLKQVNPYYIKWKNGNTEKVDKRALEKLKDQHPNWMSDF